MADATGDREAVHAAAVGTRYLLKFEEDTLSERPLWIRLIIEFLGTFLLVTVAAGSGVINHYVGGGPMRRAAGRPCKGGPAPMGLDDDQIDDPAYRPRAQWRPATGTGTVQPADQSACALCAAGRRPVRFLRHAG